ncbi:MAG TPA: transcription antitermination factor NusB [Microthrixaceae bacterium]|jgi:N utilization substance protein B|nr:transcription antitermination factor NusB [Microthrixaceae bacterium]HQF95014.1 transcription antitermination factor NusB [Microthrixaceae bacterium]
MTDISSAEVGRHEARERAVQLCYEAEQRSLSHADILDEQVIDPEPYTGVLVIGVGRHQGQIDGLLSRFAKGWTIERMPALDRAILRVGMYELGHEPEVPTAVVLNEAVELANSYSTDDSGRFVNGVLAAAARELRAD